MCRILLVTFAVEIFCLLEITRGIARKEGLGN